MTVYIASINGVRNSKIRANIIDALHDLTIMMRDDPTLTCTDVNIICSKLKEEISKNCQYLWFKAFNGSIYAIEEVRVE